MLRWLLVSLILALSSCGAFAQVSGMPSKPKFQSVTIAGVPAPQAFRAYLKADVTYSANTVQADVSDLSITLPVLPGIVGWDVTAHWVVRASTDGSGGFRAGLTWSGTNPASYMGARNDGGCNDNDSLLAISALGGVSCTGVGPTSNPTRIKLSFRWLTNSGGVLKVKAAQNTSVANGTTFMVGSYIEAVPIR